MKRIEAEYPYTGYYLYIVYHKGEGRNYANLVPINKESGLKRKTISYTRYIMCVKEQRILNKNEHVDHIDNVKSNDDIDNLQILSLKENNIKEKRRHGHKMVILKCPNCGIVFERPKNQTHLQKRKNHFTSCCRACASKFSALMQYYPKSKKISIGLKENIIKEYIKHDSF